jgi:hypothetical protein
LKNRIETFKNLSSLIGKEKVIWRFDPLIVSNELPPRELLKRIWNIGNQIKGFTDKLVFSFVDVKAYKKVQNNLVKQTSYFDKENVHQAELTKEQINEVVEGLYKIKLAWANNNWDIEFATCCEDVNLEQYGIIHNKCIDDDLMRNLFPKDKELMFFLKYGELPNINKRKLLQKKLKDTGQRKICGCIFSKDIGMYNTCPHHCVYCYANTSQKIVEENFGSHSPFSEGIVSV